MRFELDPWEEPWGAGHVWPERFSGMLRAHYSLMWVRWTFQVREAAHQWRREVWAREG